MIIIMIIIIMYYCYYYYYHYHYHDYWNELFQSFHEIIFSHQAAMLLCHKKIYRIKLGYEVHPKDLAMCLIY